MFRLLLVFALVVAVVLAALTAFGSTGVWTAGVLVVAVVAMAIPRRLPLSDAVLILLLVMPGALLVPFIRYAKEAARQSMCISSLATLELALNDYHASYGAFPPAYTIDDDGRPMHSWRVRLLPYLEGAALYEEYRFDEPWDSPNNRRLTSRMPRFFRCLADGRPRETGVTNYVALIGPGAAWAGPPGRRSDDFGESPTLMVVETFASDICWLEPRDLSVEEFLAELAPEPTFLQWWLQLPPPLWRYQHSPCGRSVLLSGGGALPYRARFVPGDLTPEAARALARLDVDSEPYLDALDGRQRRPAVLAVLPVTEDAIRWGGFCTLLAAAVGLLTAVRGVRRPWDERKRRDEERPSSQAPVGQVRPRGGAERPRALSSAARHANPPRR